MYISPYRAPNSRYNRDSILHVPCCHQVAVVAFIRRSKVSNVDLNSGFPAGIFRLTTKCQWQRMTGQNLLALLVKSAQRKKEAKSNIYAVVGSRVTAIQFLRKMRHHENYSRFPIKVAQCVSRALCPEKYKSRGRAVRTSLYSEFAHRSRTKIMILKPESIVWEETKRLYSYSPINPVLRKQFCIHYWHLE